jgi:hypothetical protein
MKKITSFLLVSALVASLCGCGAKAVNPNALIVTEVVEDVEFTIVLDKQEYVLGDLVSVTTTAKNIGSEVLYIAGSNSYDMSGAVNARLGIPGESGEDDFWFPDDKWNVQFNYETYYFELKPGESITHKQHFDTGSTRNENWKAEYLDNMPEVTLSARLSLGHRDDDTLFGFLNHEFPVVIQAKKYDNALKEMLLGIYESKLTDKILLSQEADDISVNIWFENENASKKYLDENFAHRMDKVLYAGKTGTVTVLLSRAELIQMAKDGFDVEVSFSG